MSTAKLRIRHTKSRFSQLLVVLGAAIVAAQGCRGQADGRQARVPVSGQVVLDGQPVEGAQVVFYPQEPGLPAAYASTDQSGNYELTTFEPQDGAAPGAYVAVVTKTKSENELTYDEADAYYRRTGRPPPVPKVKHLLPKAYSSHETSALTCEVTSKGANEFRLELTAATSQP